MHSDDGQDKRSDEREQLDGVPRLLVLAKMRSILDAFTPIKPELTMSELSALTGFPASTTTRFVKNLVHDGLLEKVDDRYRIGLAVVRWAGMALRGRDLVDVAGPVLSWLRDESGESVQLCVREGRFAVVIGAASSFHSVARQMRVGEMNYLHAGSTGRIFLAFDPRAFDALGDGPLEAFTGQTTTDRTELLASAERVREQGYAVTTEERNDGAVGISAPVFDVTGALAGSVGISGPTSRMLPETLDEQIALVVEAGHRLTESLGSGRIAAVSS
jgi:DNA-binding IclR family transcriptional regulator